MRFLAVIFLIFCVVFGASRVHADNSEALPPLGIWVGQSIQPDFLLDLKTDKTPSAADAPAQIQPLKKEQIIPFIGLSLTQPFDFQK